MFDQVAALIVDESKWLPVSFGLAGLAVVLQLARHRDTTAPPRRRVLAALTLLAGVTIGVMAIGHLLAVTVKLAMGTLAGSRPLLYGIGLALAVPAWALTRHAGAVLGSADHGRMTVGLHGWLAATLLVMGPHNLPLAAPALLNIGYHLHDRRVVGWAIVAAAVVVNAGLFVGSLIFMASGQSFEQFQGIE